jgi:hypothetical protein
MSSSRAGHWGALLVGAFLLSACGSGEAEVRTDTATTATSECAHVIDVVVAESGDTYSFAVTVASDETGWDKYADGWELRAPDGEVLGFHELLHPHVEEQPFTRSLGGVAVPAGVMVVTVAAKDSVLGYCGETFDITLPGR